MFDKNSRGKGQKKVIFNRREKRSWARPCLKNPDDVWKTRMKARVYKCDLTTHVDNVCNWLLPIISSHHSSEFWGEKYNNKTYFIHLFVGINLKMPRSYLHSLRGYREKNIADQMVRKWPALAVSWWWVGSSRTSTPPGARIFFY